jgi:ribosomal protein S18 acetylase RimI-like enzyme
MPPELRAHLYDNGWTVFEEVKVMTADLVNAELPETMAHLPTHDIGRFVEASLKVGDEDLSLRSPIAEIVSSIKPNLGLFIKEEVEGDPHATVICVQDNDLAGVLSLEVVSAARRMGVGSEILTSALRWARISGAKTAWLQVVSTNVPALALYENFGFEEAYTYRYWGKDNS